jgi:putative membrane protein
MRSLASLAAALTLMAGAASAQTSQTATSEAKAGPDITNTNPAAPIAGANSFTEDQARDRLEQNGFREIGSLVKDDHGVWRGSARKDGRPFAVAIDYQGNVVAKN